MFRRLPLYTLPRACKTSILAPNVRHAYPQRGAFGASTVIGPKSINTMPKPLIDPGVLRPASLPNHLNQKRSLNTQSEDASRDDRRSGRTLPAIAVASAAVVLTASVLNLLEELIFPGRGTICDDAKLADTQEQDLTALFPDRYKNISARALHEFLFELVKTREDGTTVETLHKLLPFKKCESKLKAEETTYLVERPGNPIVRWDSNIVGNKNVTEDRCAYHIVPTGLLRGLAAYEDGGEGDRSFWSARRRVRRAIIPDDVPLTTTGGKRGRSRALLQMTCDPLPGDGGEDVAIFSVFDGHSAPYGWIIAEMLRRTLHPLLMSCMAGLHERRERFGGLREDEKETLTEQMKITFEAWNEDLKYAPWALVQGDTARLPRTPSSLPASPAMMALALPGNAGSAAVTAVVDAKSNTLMVGNLGDCRAIAGWYNEDSDEWRCDVLTEDMQAGNPTEAQRIHKEHPGEEGHAILNGFQGIDRILGSLMLSRCFGDPDYNLTTDDYEELVTTVGVSYTFNATRTDSLTPPYVSARPEVAVRDMNLPARFPFVPKAKGERLAFLVMGSDGLFAQMTSEEAVQLAAAHMKKNDIKRHLTQVEEESGSISKHHLNELIKVRPSNNRPWPIEALPGTAERTAAYCTDKWALKDENAATHLIRNTHLGGDELMWQRMMSTDAELRDDTTAIVIFFEHPQVDAKKQDR